MFGKIVEWVQPKDSINTEYLLIYYIVGEFNVNDDNIENVRTAQL